MIDYALAGALGACLAVLFMAPHLICKPTILESGATKRFFPDLVEQRRRKKFCGAAIQCQPESRKRNEVSQIVRDLFEIGGAASGRVVAVLPWRLYRDLPLTADRLHVCVAKKFHCQDSLVGAWRKEVVR
jgi:hypothetical protein